MNSNDNKEMVRGRSYQSVCPRIFWEGEYLGLDGLRTIAAVAKVPFTVMGGIKQNHLPGLINAGARIIAIVTAVTAAPDVEEATRTLLKQTVSSCQ